LWAIRDKLAKKIEAVRSQVGRMLLNKFNGPKRPDRLNELVRKLQSAGFVKPGDRDRPPSKPI